MVAVAAAAVAAVAAAAAAPAAAATPAAAAAAAAGSKHMSRNITDFFKPSMSKQEGGSALPHGFAWSAIKR